VVVGGVPLPLHGARGPGHLAFRATEEEIDHWREHLTAQGIEIESEVAWPGGGRSIYFRDPAGNSLEFATGTLWGI
jgi:catechol 2,3-dioxygenase-like lactoylglutathione lyase family enzyme